MNKRLKIKEAILEYRNANPGKKMTMKQLADMVIDDRKMTVEAKQVYFTNWNNGNLGNVPIVVKDAPERYQVVMTDAPDKYIRRICEILGCSYEFLTGHKEKKVCK